MLPHLGVHRGREQHRTVRHQQRVGKVVAGLSRGCLGQQISRGRRDYHQVRFMAQPDVVNLMDVVEDAVADRVAGQCLPRGSAHKTRGRLRGYHGDVMACFSKKPEE